MTQRTSQMLQSHPRPADLFNTDALAECINACFECENICTSCADACLAEEQHLAHMVRCIRTCLDCADVCGATGRLLARLTESNRELLRAQLQACAVACKVCGDECEQHAKGMNMQHCQVCMEACRRCEQACRALLSA